LLGVICWLYWGTWGSRPEIWWLDARTVVIDGTALDIYRDPPLRDY
jgi:hypothetical protein